MPPPGVLSNDRDPDGDDLTATLVSGPSDGQLDLNPDGSLTYTPDRNSAGTDSFTYKVGEAAADSEAATVTITVAPVDDGCTTRGTQDDDRLTGTPRNDVICGLGGNDTIDGFGDGDVLRGGTGADVLRDDSGKDRLLGGAGNDRIDGRDGRPRDVLNGGSGKNTCARDEGDASRNCP